MTINRNLANTATFLSANGQYASSNLSGQVASSRVSGLAAIATSGSASDLTGTIPASVGSTGDNAMIVGTASGTWTKPATVKSIKVTVVGGGGNFVGEFFQKRVIDLGVKRIYSIRIFRV